ncbi:olfactory receptor 1571-like [Ailuropoda melanoleuca]|uniref:olfactory receptor 1571-like n=1 Tax=Ailuropoda melanoleuca TaxID=9646 RepID=UPI001494DCD9|nr:olfactory receptor 1571-like [Ailuropoda melanoleuca]
METAPSEQTQGAVNISSAVERQHVDPWTGRDMVANIFVFLSLAGGPMLHCFLLSCLGTGLQSPSSTIQGGIGTSTRTLSSYRPTSSDFHLHIPMYFFLANLSFVDICFTSTTIPRLLWNIQTQSKVITYEGCITQMYFFIIFADWDHFLLTVMSYDRFVAICQPLHYMAIMNPRLCGLLVLESWVISVLNSLLQSLMVLRLSFCSEVEIPHFFCELNQVIGHACSDTFVNDMMLNFGILLLGGAPLAGIIYSYSKIVSSIHKISSAQGKYKAFSTCASHLSVSRSTGNLGLDKTWSSLVQSCV